MRSRRAFLQELTAAAAALALDPLRGVSAFANEYANDRLGLSVRLPEGWEFSSVADFAALRERQVLQDAMRGRGDEPHPLQDPENLPVFLFEDPRHREGEFAPGIALYDEPLEEALPRNQAAAHRRFLGWLSRSYRDLAVAEEPREVALQGARGTLSRASYLHEIDSGETFPLEIRTLLVVRPPRVHTVYLTDSSVRPRIDPRVWRDFLASVRYRPPGTP